MYRGKSANKRLTVRRSFKSANKFMGHVPSSGNDLPGDFELSGERIEPVAQISLFGDYLWPVAVAFTFAFLAGILAILALNEFGYSLTFRQAAIVFVALMLVAFLIAVGRVFSLKWVKEVMDEFLPEPEPQPMIELTVNIKDPTGKVNRVLRPQFSVSPNQLMEFVIGVIHVNKGLAVKTWVDDERLFTRPEFDQFMTDCEKAKLIERKGSAVNSPRVLTETGRETFQEIWENRAELLR